jgi:hypothetical protein
MPILSPIIKGAAKRKNKISKEKLIFNSYKTQKKTLKKLLRKASLTSFGEYYDFLDILRHEDIINEFKKKIPVYTYESIFMEWWYRALSGETYVCWPGKVKYFALSSGTSGSSSKRIPVTNDMIRSIRRTSIKQGISIANYGFPKGFFQKGVLMLGGSTHLQYNGTYYEGDLSGITTGKIPFWFQYYYKPGKRISKERDWSTKLNEIVKKAKDWDIGAIVGVPAWLQILLEKIISYYNLKNIHEIWPNLSVFIHGGVSFDPYINGFEKLLGHPLIYIETYLASEGFVAFQSRPNTHSMQMVLNNGLFYEFIPFNKDNFDSDGDMLENPETLTINQVKENEEYALLLSNCSGAWRYLIGDTIKFISVEYKEIQITGRTKHFLSLCGEHLSEENMNKTIKMLEDKLNIEIREFTVAGIKHGSMFAHKWYIGTDNEIEPEIVKNKIDDYLKIMNDDYRVERISAIKDVIVEILPTKIFYDWMKENKKEGGQHKFPRVLKNEKFFQWEKYLKECNYSGIGNKVYGIRE